MRASDKAYQALRADIMSGELSPGQTIAEVEQAERIGVSRTPVREAVSRLLAEGLAEPNPGRGVIVSPISADNVQALFELRTSLDCTAAALAAQKGDPRIFTDLAQQFLKVLSRLEAGSRELTGYYRLVEQLDKCIDEATANRYLVQAQNSIRSQLTRLRKMSKANPRRLAQAAQEHAQIAQSIASGNPELAQAATKIHLHNALMAIKEASEADQQRAARAA